MKKFLITFSSTLMILGAAVFAPDALAESPESRSVAPTFEERRAAAKSDLKARAARHDATREAESQTLRSVRSSVRPVPRTKSVADRKIRPPSSVVRGSAGHTEILCLDVPLRDPSTWIDSMSAAGGRMTLSSVCVPWTRTTAGSAG